MHGVLNGLSIAAGFVSGALWFYAAIIKVPTNIGSGYGKLVGVEEMTAGFRACTHKSRLYNATCS